MKILWLSEKHLVHVFFAIYSIPYNFVVAFGCWMCICAVCCLLHSMSLGIENLVWWLDDYVDSCVFFFFSKCQKYENDSRCEKKTERLCIMERLKKFGSSLGENTCSNVQYSQFTENIYYFEKTIQAIHVTILALESMFVVQIGRFKTTCFT